MESGSGVDRGDGAAFDNPVTVFRVVGDGEAETGPLAISWLSNAIDRVPGLADTAAHLRQQMIDEREQCREYTRDYGEDDPRVADWRWSPIA
jgi:phosphoketolase